MRKHLVILMGVVSGCGEPAKPRLLYTIVWNPCCGIVFAMGAKQSRLLNK
jgi:hypothetical protein